MTGSYCLALEADLSTCLLYTSTEKIEQNSDSNLVISDDGKILYYVDDIPEEESAGELYEIEIVEGKLQKAVL